LSGTAAPLFEAAIRIEGAMALADVMLPETGDSDLRWHMLEVKSSTGVKDYHREDLAVQTYIATKAGIDLTSASLAHVDTSFAYPGGGDCQAESPEKPHSPPKTKAAQLIIPTGKTQ